MLRSRLAKQRAQYDESNIFNKQIHSAKRNIETVKRRDEIFFIPPFQLSFGVLREFWEIV
ncbi:hypothetical protein AGATL06_29920 [Agathobaculum sp. TL06]